MAPGGASNGRVFGQAMKKKSSSSSRYQRQFGAKGGNPSSSTPDEAALQAARAAEWRRAKQAAGEALDRKFGMERFGEASAQQGQEEVQQRRGWLYNVLPTTVTVAEDATTTTGGPERAGLDLFFCSEDSTSPTFKSTVLYRPYFYLLPDLLLLDPNHSARNPQTEVILELLTSTLMRLYEGSLFSVEVVDRVDLDQTNHLSPNNKVGRPALKLVFDTVAQLYDVRSKLKEVLEANTRRQEGRRQTQWTNSLNGGGSQQYDDEYLQNPLLLLVDMREYDVPYVVRVCTDLDIRAGTWYTVETTSEAGGSGVRLLDPDRETVAHPTVLAFDIECTKAPLKFPSADHDEIFMISYMVSTTTGSQGYLIVSRSVVSEHVDDFEYTPKPNYPGSFVIFNEADEKALLQRFFAEYQKHRPQIVVTYNGDFFDWPFVDARAKHHGLDLFQETGVEQTSKEEYRGRTSVHLDAFHWVQRDSYLPQGSQGLKAVTKYKLGYDPVEVDPEDMVRFARERPVHMATYSVSDAVATYYLYEKYVHLFIFSLCTIIPMGPEDVLRKGSGTLCETLLMVQAYKKSIVCPNKQSEPAAKFHHGHLLESETYIGGKVECLETGVYRSDIEYDFDLKPAAFQQLIDNVDRDLTFAIQVEGGKKVEDIINYDEIRQQIIDELGMLRDRPKRVEKPYIYHLDVGAMYPNIILTNRLQPSAMVDDATCAACDFNQSKNECKRRMEWVWRGDYSPASRSEYERTKDQLSRETNFRDGLAFHQLPTSEQGELVSDRLKTYARKAYKRTKITEEVTREDVVCMRENDFYVDTVRQFRDRRYEYKTLKKNWGKKAAKAEDGVTKKQCLDRVGVYDSLQIAHKCILNSFYGYVMRRGARWRSIEMAGIVTKTGADIITQARILVEQIGRPLELDTDGIWCILPKSFPDVYTFQAADGSTLKLEYPCVMLNADVHAKFTNDQYQTLVDPDRGIYEKRSECSIFFEVDGPYRCMVLPASTEEGKLLKKRYAVFNFDGSLAELKGFELKRRGELELIKTFQSQVFERFLDGSSLIECYDSVADIANHWIDVIDTRGESLEDDELVDLISENRNMSRQLDDYGDQKGTSQTTARRLGEFLGAEIIKDKGLNCKFIIAEQPYGAPVTERAIPTAIWKAEPAVMKHFLRKWLKAPGLDASALDIRSVLDWDYYLDRLAKTIQKIITIPAALQKVPNPVPRIDHPSWLDSKVKQLNDRFQQTSILDTFSRKTGPVRGSQSGLVVDIEDSVGSSYAAKVPVVRTMKRLKDREAAEENANEDSKRAELSKDTFNDWLQQRKRSWRKSRKERRTVVRSQGREDGGKKQRKAVSVQGFVREAALSIVQREWQIVEIREMSTFDSVASTSTTASGDFIVWAMVGNDSLQKIYVSVPRVVYLTVRDEIEKTGEGDVIDLRKVEKHLPHSKRSKLTYEVAMPEHLYRSKKWIEYLKPVSPSRLKESVYESMYESGTPLSMRILAELGSQARVKSSASRSSKSKSYSLAELSRVDKPSDGEYLNEYISYRRVFLYVRINPRTKTGIVALFQLNGGSGSFKSEGNEHVDPTRPSQSDAGSVDVGATCSVWVVKPRSRNAQKSLSLKQCSTVVSQLFESLQEAAGIDSDYACVSPESLVDIANLSFVESEELAYAGANEAISASTRSSSGPLFVLLTSSKPAGQLRRYMSTFSSCPVVTMPFPPGPAHNPSLATLPSLNWEQPAVQLCLEAYMFMTVIAFPKRVAYARYGQIPVGNLGDDENVTFYDVGLSRMIQKNRAVSWASPVPARPDLGVNFLPSSDGVVYSTLESSTTALNQEELWGDDDLVSPVVRRPGCYRSVCVDIDVQDLAIAALIDAAASVTGPILSSHEAGTNPNSPSSVTLFDGGHSFKQNGPLGDEMSTSVSLPIVRALVGGWLRDAFALGSLVADELLHHIYRLIADPTSLLHDPALHRAVHGLLRGTFTRLLSELQRLGCSIVYASFNKVTVATSKLNLADAEEHINFVIATVRDRASNGPETDALGRISLRPRQFHAHFVFLDEYNFGTMQLERAHAEDISDELDFVISEDDEVGSVIVPSVVTAWSIMNYLGSETAMEYFRVIIGRFSKDVFKRQRELTTGGDALTLAVDNDGKLLAFKKTMIGKHFASYLTRAVSEIAHEAADPDFQPPISAGRSHLTTPALDFIKSVIAVLELDSEVDKEVQVLKRSLLSQLGVAEYSRLAHWENPCPKFMLPDIFCSECQESKDLNLCYVPPRVLDEAIEKGWVCDDCNTPYDVHLIEGRLLGYLQKRMVRYQLQDIRDTKSNRVATRALSPQLEFSAGLKLTVNRDDMHDELRLLRSLADFHELEDLGQETSSILRDYQEVAEH